MAETVQEEPVIDFSAYSQKHSIIVPRAVVSVACLLLVFVVGFNAGKKTEPVLVEETVMEEAPEIVDQQPDTKPVVSVKLDTESGVELVIDEDMKVVGYTASDAEVQVMLDELELEGEEYVNAVDKIINALRQKGLLKNENETGNQTNTEGAIPQVNNNVPANNSELNNAITDTQQSVTNIVEDTTDTVVQTTDQATDIVEDVSGATNAIINDVVDTTDTILNDVNGTVGHIVNTFIH